MKILEINAELLTEDSTFRYQNNASTACRSELWAEGKSTAAGRQAREARTIKGGGSHQKKAGGVGELKKKNTLKDKQTKPSPSLNLM